MEHETSVLSDVDVDSLGQQDAAATDSNELEDMTADVALAAAREMLRQHHHRCKMLQ